ncbi:MAG: hypothetical protein A3D96_00490 [Chlamydiae bacterium RIFCSPHIGHO2_12_FULL_44_59]|nr:MAG: hypothetical protein A2796_07635 [Chlamydiae bacterium RIFCSPHIGHO2_01_FULL_44_39]OGN58268.1 MAG: hypothetical protein A3C42_06230 [Chlamydiae bacterium RIFCSPHIGHO2_02_FULL_45_9]OGN60867.1 MAG: hypothetical protein A3D96_00490 [Chlamydiae bacterium RIFCSPHIGHO2_12_FULL_44_59]OGN66743.1 MAG: hypothetical protein A2978_03125 [Chlamydiae bacterium RIFCSPLOWO2_01_FULL_44_52]OGN67393.1 MAG: hypothetical protein A3I67_06320 [Chlamydiae bacterium RIFCSPLOWO2_02_FULL_45_22]OGN70668.1 MAG: hyp
MFVFGALRLGKNGLIALSGLLTIFANLFVVKEIRLFGLAVTCSDVFAVGAILSFNLLQEYFGKQEAKLAVKISLLGLLFFVLLVRIHLLYVPSGHDLTQGAFETVFSHSFRIVSASIATFYIVQLWDVWFFEWLQNRNHFLSVRVAISLCVSQFFDTVLFSILGLYGIVESVIHVILVSFAVKCTIILLSSPLVSFAKRFVKDEIPV